jgi:hypothetical protein
LANISGSARGSALAIGVLLNGKPVSRRTFRKRRIRSVQGLNDLLKPDIYHAVNLIGRQHFYWKANHILNRILGVRIFRQVSIGSKAPYGRSFEMNGSSPECELEQLEVDSLNHPSFEDVVLLSLDIADSTNAAGVMIKPLKVNIKEVGTLSYLYRKVELPTRKLRVGLAVK